MTAYMVKYTFISAFHWLLHVTVRLTSSYDIVKWWYLSQPCLNKNYELFVKDRKGTILPIKLYWNSDWWNRILSDREVKETRRTKHYTYTTQTTKNIKKNYNNTLLREWKGLNSINLGVICCGILDLEWVMGWLVPSALKVIISTILYVSFLLLYVCIYLKFIFLNPNKVFLVMIYLIAGSWLFKALNCFLQWRNGIALLKLFYASRYQCNVT